MTLKNSLSIRAIARGVLSTPQASAIAHISIDIDMSNVYLDVWP
ncbi:MAG: hypothetical protein ACFB0G_08710 [Leptolyngbyaceae cyanobacterium]